jgi:Protein of unknown function (DUF3499)
VGDVPSTTDRDVLVTVSAMARQCSRTGCAAPADATLTYQYGRSFVWLDDLAAERDPHSYDLCHRHAARLSVPNGWRLEDRRSGHQLIQSSGRRLAG